jgi:hypothetical protein
MADAGAVQFAATYRETGWLSLDFGLHTFQQVSPVFCEVELSVLEGEAVTGDVVLRDLVPAAMLDGYAGVVSDLLEADIDFGRLFRPERALTP